MKKLNIKISLLLILVAFLCLPAAVMAGNAAYTYDAYDRVERATYDNGPVVEYTYDAAGNLASRTVIDTVLHVSIDGSGSGSVAVSGGTPCGAGCYRFDNATTVTLTATPDAGYLIGYWSGTSCGQVLTCDVTVDSMKHVSAVFYPSSFTITAGAGENGAVEPLGINDVNYGDSLSFTITPDDGYVTASLLVDSQPVGITDIYTFVNISASHNIEASFAVDTVTVTPSSHDFGTIECGATSTATTFTLENTGTSNRTVDSVALSGSAAAEYTIVTDTCINSTLAPSAMCTVDITFSPALKWSGRTAELVFDFAEEGTSIVKSVLTGQGGVSCPGDMGALVPIIDLLLTDEKEKTIEPGIFAPILLLLE